MDTTTLADHHAKAVAKPITMRMSRMAITFKTCAIRPKPPSTSR